MNSSLIPVLLAFLGVVAALASYRDIKRGGARFYTLEREAILRRASLTLMASMLLFIAAISLLMLGQQPDTAVPPAESEAVQGAATITPTPELEQFPPLPTETATPDLSFPTATPTRPVCRAVVEGTFGNGLTLRSEPGGAQISILAEADLVTVLDQAPTNANGIEWRQVRSLFGDEGWVAADYLTIVP